MPQSSLVFVAIVAVWVLVLLPLWVAHREDSGEARTDDRDSKNLRVLSLRERRRVAQGSTPRPSSTPLITGPRVSLDEERASSVPSGADTVRTTTVRTPQRTAAVRRARTLVGLIGIATISWLATLLPGIAWWFAVPATVLLIADVVALVVTARARERARRDVTREVSRRIRQAELDVRREQLTHGAIEPDAAGPVWTELVASTEPEVVAAAPTASTWTPRPVPRPTYMLKPVIERPEQEVPADLPGAVPAAAEVASPPVLSVVPEPASAVKGEPLAAADGSFSSSTGERDSRPWAREHTWADDLDLMLARRRAVGS